MKALVVGTSIIDIFVTPLNPEQTPVIKQRVSVELGDKVPIDIKKLTLGGNGANVSVGLTRLGIPTTFYTYIGSDILAQEVTENIKKEGVDVIAEKGKGYTSLSFIFDVKNDRIIYSHHPREDHAFEYQAEKTDYIYLTSIGDPWESVFRKVLSYQEQTNATLSFSPGSAQLANMSEIFFETIHRSQSLFMNKEEAEMILEKFGSPHRSTEEILRELRKLGPTLISITDGKRGAYVLDAEKKIYRIEPFSDDKVHEKTGAGDAYATGFLAGMMEEKSTSECMKMGSFNSYAVMQEIGATTGLLRRENMLQLLTAHPDYQPEEL